jgi:RNA polymerase sigma-70 factor, ECF subfamily
MILAIPRKTDNDAAYEAGQLITRSREGDVRAFRRLVESHQHYAFSLAFRIVCDTEDARDIAQEAFIRVWRNLRTFNPEVKFTTWLYRIVVNLSLDRLKGERRKKRFLVPASKGLDSAFRDDRALDEDVANRDLAGRIRTMAEGLPLKQRLVFVLRDLQDLTVEEVSEILEMSHASVKTNLCYARRHIRHLLEHLGVER